jgi:prophage regulatory protein
VRICSPPIRMVIQMSRAKGTADDGFATALALADSECPPASPQDATAVRIIRLPEVMRRTGLARSTIYLYVTEKRFPSPVALGEGERGAVGWVEEEVTAWIWDKIRKSRS